MEKNGLEQNCDFMKADFMKIPQPGLFSLVFYKMLFLMHGTSFQCICLWTVASVRAFLRFFHFVVSPCTAPPDNTYDAIYAIEATCHAPSKVGIYSEIFRVLKPGALFAGKCARCVVFFGYLSFLPMITD